MIQTADPMLTIKTEGFLTRLWQLSGGDTGQRLCAGAVGAELGLPLEDTLEIIARLQEEGAIHRCGRLDPPDGPEVHLTAHGAVRASSAGE